MLGVVGHSRLEDLFESIPEKLRVRGDLAVQAGASEQEVRAELTRLAARNVDASCHPWFLGAGVYAHYIPSAVDALISRSEFYTAYTPYQPEFSQGTLQAIFEWQTMISGLTGMDVSNASMYDGASAVAEAALMALRITRRGSVAVSATLHPNYRRVLDTYLSGLDARVTTIPRGPDGRLEDLAAAITADTACVVVQQPNFLGVVEDLPAAAETAHAGGALLVTCVNEALSLALLKSPGEQGSDVVCGEAQSFGVPMAFGGPHLGFLTTSSRYVRHMPGRLVGETLDTRGKRGFVLTLSTREQHIRRERATSNICTNQGLCLLMATIYLALQGRVGLRQLALANLAKAEYLKTRVRQTPGLSLPMDTASFNEFVVTTPDSATDALARARERGIVGGLDLRPHMPELGSSVLVCATELASKEDMDTLVGCLAGTAS
jgi:glycine dehydrogenase subunit 1